MLGASCGSTLRLEADARHAVAAEERAQARAAEWAQEKAVVDAVRAEMQASRERCEAVLAEADTMRAGWRAERGWRAGGRRRQSAR